MFVGMERGGTRQSIENHQLVIIQQQQHRPFHVVTYRLYRRKDGVLFVSRNVKDAISKLSVDFLAKQQNPIEALTSELDLCKPKDETEEDEGSESPFRNAALGATPALRPLPSQTVRSIQHHIMFMPGSGMSSSAPRNFIAML